MYSNMQEFLSARHTPASCARSVNSEQEIRWYQDISLVVIILAFLVLSSVSQLISPATVHAAAANINCGNPTSGHCYGLQDWSGGMAGSRTDIKVVSLSCNSSCQSTGFLDNEMWLFDRQTSSCTSSHWTECWVEAGYLNDGVCGFCYFWADVRPVDGNNFNLHYVNNGFTDAFYDIGHSTRFSIYQQGTNQFEVDFAVQGCSSGCSSNQTYYSTNNTMSPNDINIGTELAGTGPNSNWGAPRADYINNYWKSNNWNAQGAGNGPGLVNANGAPPPYQAWANGVGGPTGGDFYTYCC